MLDENKDSLTVMVPDWDEVMDTGDDWFSKTLRGLQCYLKASNQTDQMEFLEKTRKCKFGSGWNEVWNKCGGFTDRIKR